MKSVAVLGSNGQLGQTLNYLADNANGLFQFYSRTEIDISDKSTIEEVFKKNTFDFCINCAAYTNVEQAEVDSESAFSVNATGTKNLAEVCKTYGVVLVHISTDYVFDGSKTEPYTETDDTNPINQYGKSKLAGETHIAEILAEHYIIRTSWLYSTYGKNFMKTIIRKINDDEKLKITTEETGTPTSCLELANFILYLLASKNAPYGIYHFSGRGSTTWYGFALEITKLYNPEKLENITSVDAFETKAKRPKYSVLDHRKTEEVYNRPLNTWQNSLSETIELFKSQTSTI